MDIIAKIAEELAIKQTQAEAAIQLIDEGNTIPFIARYRKEATGALNDEVLRNLADRLTYLRNLEEKKATVLSGIEEQGKLTEGHCKALLAIQDPKEQLKTAIRIIEKGETVRIAEKKAHHQKNNKNIAQKYDYVYKDIEDTFQGFFGTKVKVDAGRRAGKIIINYTNNDELERILGLIKK